MKKNLSFVCFKFKQKSKKKVIIYGDKTNANKLSIKTCITKQLNLNKLNKRKIKNLKSKLEEKHKKEKLQEGLKLRQRNKNIKKKEGQLS